MITQTMSCYLNTGSPNMHKHHWVP